MLLLTINFPNCMCQCCPRISCIMFISDAFIGPGCEYVIAPVARYAGPWGIPVLTAGAQAEAFGYKQPSYSTLTRMMGSYTQAGVAIRKVFEVNPWEYDINVVLV